MKSSQIDAVHCSSTEDRGTVFEIDKENHLLTIETKFKNHWVVIFLIVFVQAKYALESKNNNNHTARYLSRIKLVQSRKGLNPRHFSIRQHVLVLHSRTNLIIFLLCMGLRFVNPYSFQKKIVGLQKNYT